MAQTTNFAAAASPIKSKLIRSFIVDYYNILGVPAVGAIQRTVNSLGEKVAIDGVLGPLTISAINRQTAKSETAVNNAYRAEIKKEYEGQGEIKAISEKQYKNLLQKYPKKLIDVNDNFWYIVLGIAFTILLILGLWMLLKN